MTWAQMKVSPEEVSRRQEVVVRMNTLWFKLNHTEDERKRKEINKKLRRIRADESGWLKKAAYWLY